jgi:hypothetical protein
MHPLEEAVNFNESMYFNLYDPAQKVGGFFRLGNRANEGYAEMTTCLYLPDGRVGFMFGRPEIDSNEAFDGGGLRFAVVRPFEELTVRYDAKVLMLDDPLAMANPKAAFTGNPTVPCVAELTFTGVSPMMGGEPVADDGSQLEQDPGTGFARGHYEQHMAGTGTLRIGDESWEISGYGLRDHSWGPRYWQSPWWYRWLTINFGADFGAMLSIVASQDGGRRIGGVILRDGAYSAVRDISIETEWSGDDVYPVSLHATARTDDGETYEIAGRIMTLVPLRNRRTSPDGEQLVTRITEGMTEWSCNQMTGYGLAEYLDQIIDGKPVGLES